MDMKHKRYTLGLYEKAMPEVSWPEKLRIASQGGGLRFRGDQH